jgi:hypothetical protein
MVGLGRASAKVFDQRQQWALAHPVGVSALVALAVTAVLLPIAAVVSSARPAIVCVALAAFFGTYVSARQKRTGAARGHALGSSTAPRRPDEGETRRGRIPPADPPAGAD